MGASRLSSGFLDERAECPLGVRAEQQSDDPAVRGRDRKIRQRLPLHPLDDVAEPGARAHGTGAERHRLLRRHVLTVADRASPQPAEDDALLVDDEAGVPACLVQALAHLAQLVVRAAGRNVGTDVCARACLASLRTFEREPGAPPVGLAGEVVVAVGDDRSAAVEQSRRLAVKLLERDVDGAGQVLVLVLGGGQYLDQLRLLLGDEPLQLVAVDRRWHQVSVSTSAKTARPAAAASRIEITLPLTSGCSASQRSAVTEETKKFSTGQQPQQASP